MATTRIIPMHINKGKTIAQCMKARIDYVKNQDKTEDARIYFVLCLCTGISRSGVCSCTESVSYEHRQWKEKRSDCVSASAIF